MMRIGCGAGFSADRLDPAVDLARDGGLDALVFECVGERTLAFGHRDRRADPDRGYNPLLGRRLRAVWPLAAARGTRIVTNMGAANPLAAGREAVRIATELGLGDGGSVAVVLGDDVTDRIGPETPLPAIGATVGDLDHDLIGANAYIGADAILPALETGAGLVIGGRLADPSMFVALLRFRHGWSADDWARLGAGTVVGHLMECGAQVTGGYFADPGFKNVPDLAFVGYPIAEVADDGSVTITKLPNAGGMVTGETVREQLMYEVHDPARYLTPDVSADFSGVRITDQGHDRVMVTGGTGHARPDLLKVTVGFDGGYLAEGEVSYAGPGAADRARLAAEVTETRLARVHGIRDDLRLDLIGLNAVHRHATYVETPDAPTDVRLRVAGRFRDRDQAEILLWEVESLLCAGPAGGGGFRGRITPTIVTHDAWLDRAEVPTRVEVLTP